MTRKRWHMMFKRSVHHKFLNVCRKIEILSRIDPLLGPLMDAITDETVIACSIVHHNTLHTIRMRKSKNSFHQIDTESLSEELISIHCSDVFRCRAILSNRDSLVHRIADGTISIQGPADTVMPLIRIMQRSLSSLRGIMRIRVAFLSIFPITGGRK